MWVLLCLNILTNIINREYEVGIVILTFILIVSSINRFNWPDDDEIIQRYCGTWRVQIYLSRLPWIFLGAPLKVNGAPGNIQGNMTALYTPWQSFPRIRWCGESSSHLIHAPVLSHSAQPDREHPANVNMYHNSIHDDVIKWKFFPRYWPFVRGIHRSQVNSPHKGQWRGPLMFSFKCARMNAWVNNREARDFRRHPAHYDVTVM